MVQRRRHFGRPWDLEWGNLAERFRRPMSAMMLAAEIAGRDAVQVVGVAVLVAQVVAGATKNFPAFVVYVMKFCEAGWPGASWNGPCPAGWLLAGWLDRFLETSPYRLRFSIGFCARWPLLFAS